MIAAVGIALAALAGIGLYVVFKDKPADPKTALATPSPTATPRPEPTPTATPRPTPTSTPAVVVVATPIPSLPPEPSPTATPVVAMATPTPPPTPTAPPATDTPVVALATPPPVPSQTPPPTPGENVTSAAGAVDTNRASPENQAIRQAVLQRIDAMPLSPTDKARLYTALDRARGLGKLVTINFATGRTDLAPKDVVNLDNTLRRPKIQRFLDDPTVVLVVLGFADVKGDDKTNKDVSERRARRVVEALRGPCNVSNIIHSLGMGGQVIAGESLEKNRVVEVWAVLP